MKNKYFRKLYNSIFEDRLITTLDGDIKSNTFAGKYIELYIKMSMKKDIITDTYETSLTRLMRISGMNLKLSKNVVATKNKLKVLEQNNLIIIDADIETLNKNDLITITFVCDENTSFTKYTQEDIKIIETLQTNDLVVYCCIRRFINNKEGKKSWISMNTIREKTGLSKNTILKSVARLRKVNLLLITTNGEKTYNNKDGFLKNPNNVYRLVAPTDTLLEDYSNLNDANIDIETDEVANLEQEEIEGIDVSIFEDNESITLGITAIDEVYRTYIGNLFEI